MIPQILIQSSDYSFFIYKRLNLQAWGPEFSWFSWSMSVVWGQLIRLSLATSVLLNVQTPTILTWFQGDAMWGGGVDGPDFPAQKPHATARRLTWNLLPFLHQLIDILGKILTSSCRRWVFASFASEKDLLVLSFPVLQIVLLLFLSAWLKDSCPLFPLLAGGSGPHVLIRPDSCSAHAYTMGT